MSTLEKKIFSIHRCANLVHRCAKKTPCQKERILNNQKSNEINIASLNTLVANPWKYKISGPMVAPIIIYKYSKITHIYI